MRGSSAIRGAWLSSGAWLLAALAAASSAESQAGVRSIDEPPVLESFSTSSRFGGFCTLSGTVTDEYAGGCYIQFGGALAGYYAAVNSDGTFTTSVEVDPYSTGPVSAQAVDEVGQESNVLWDEAS